jgi:hypothetical protein
MMGFEVCHCHSVEGMSQIKQLHSQIDSAVTVEMLQDEVCASIP